MTRNKLFLSFHSDPEHAPEHRGLAQLVAYYLRIQRDLEVFCYDRPWNNTTWAGYVTPFLKASKSLVVFAGRKAGRGQIDEVTKFCNLHRAAGFLMVLSLDGDIPDEIAKQVADFPLKQCYILPRLPAKWDDNLQYHAKELARKIHARCGLSQFWDDGIPIGYPFDYEKAVIDQYLARPSLIADLAQKDRAPLMQGFPVDWPTLPDPRQTHRRQMYPNPLEPDEVGTFRTHDDVVIVDPRGLYHDGKSGSCGCLRKRGLIFLEAGPREHLLLPARDRKVLHVGIVVSGGIAPGINSVVKGIVERHISYHEAAQNADHKKRGKTTAQAAYTLKITMFSNGFRGILGTDGNTAKTSRSWSSAKDGEIGELKALVHELAAKGGSLIETFRFDDLLPDNDKRREQLDRVVECLSNQAVDNLYIIGGEGSMRAAHALQTRAVLLAKKGSHIPHIVGIPKTMDNDILWVWQSFGFLSSVEKAREFIVHLNTEVSANPRLCIIQLFGSDSGFVVSHAALGSGGACRAALIPEVSFSLTALGDYVGWTLTQPQNHRHGSIVLAETAIPIDVDDYLDEPEYGVNADECAAVRVFTGSALFAPNDIAKEKRRSVLEALLHENSLDDYQREFVTLKKCLPEKTRPLLEWLATCKDNGDCVDRCWPTVVVALNELLRQEDVWRGLHDFVKGHGGDTPVGQRGPALLAALELLCRNDAAVWSTNKLHDALRDLTALMNLPFEAISIIRLMLDRQAQSQRPIEKTGRCFLLGQLRKRLTETLNRTILETLLPDSLPRMEGDQSERRVFGQTPDALRGAGVKIIAAYLQKRIREMNPQGKAGSWADYRVLVNQPRHLIRSMDPSCHDVILCSRLGKLAVDSALGGYRGFMISQWLTEYVLVPLELVVLGRKRVPPTGIFWKSVIANTKQPPNLWWPTATDAPMKNTKNRRREASGTRKTCTRHQAD